LGLLLAVADAACGQAPVDDAAWLADTLEVGRGDVLADVGAGLGEMSLRLSAAVGPAGAIYASELGTERVAELQTIVDSAGASNVRVIEGHANRTNLPASCCDAIVVRFVYHHFANPPTMNASLFTSLKPGGRLAVIDFEPDGPESPDPAGRGDGDQHGISVETLRRELEDAGFSILSAEVFPPFSAIYLVALKPGPN
jgi:ubiquinone/menaquinone biosynthesis C-methylase UbiE